MVNEKQSYALINPKNGKILKINGALQLFRLKTTAILVRNKLQISLNSEIEIKKMKETSPQGAWKRKKEEKEEEKEEENETL